MEFIDLKAQYARIEKDVNDRIKKVLSHGQYIMGSEALELEKALAAYVGVKHCLGVSSGTDALLIALMALDVGHGDEVITSAFSFFATAEVIALLGAKPVFVDADPLTYNLDVKLLEAAITPKTKAIMPVSLYGQCADFDEINAIAAKHNLPVVEDGAQSFGAVYQNRKSCGLSTIGCTSFFPSKPLGCYGDGGAIFTDDDALAEMMGQIRNHGQRGRYEHVRLGVNGRLDTIQAAVLLAKLEIFPEELMLRTKIAQRYHAALTAKGIARPYIKSGNTSVYAQYTLQLDAREAFRAAMTAKGIPTAVHYPAALSALPVLQCQSDAPVADGLAKRVVSIPMHPYLSVEQQMFVTESIQAWILSR